MKLKQAMKSILRAIVRALGYVDPEDLPLRKCVRVLVMHGDGVCINKKRDSEGRFRGYDFPGGSSEGRSVNDVLTEQCIREAGIEISNIRPLNVRSVRTYAPDGKERRRLRSYRGDETEYYIAALKGVNGSHHSSMEDALRMHFLQIPSAMKCINSEPGLCSTEAKLQALAVATRVAAGNPAAWPYGAGVRE